MCYSATLWNLNVKILSLWSQLLQSAFWNDRHLHSFDQICGLLTVQIWTWLTTKFGEKCSSGSIRLKFMKLINWNNICSMPAWFGAKRDGYNTINERHKHLACIRARGGHLMSWALNLVNSFLILWTFEVNRCYWVKYVWVAIVDSLYFAK